MNPSLRCLTSLMMGEPPAYLRKTIRRNLLVFDYGGGTLDVSLVRARFDSRSQTGLKVENLAISQYRRLGGDDVDHAVMDEVVWPQIEAQLGKTRDCLARCTPDARRHADPDGRERPQGKHLPPDRATAGPDQPCVQLKR